LHVGHHIVRLTEDRTFALWQLAFFLQVEGQADITDGRAEGEAEPAVDQDVAEILNFSDQASFSRFFKRNTGLSPSEFKKKNSV
jgi:hypothetical protein